MLLKSKICLTTVAIYEMLAVSVLHFQHVCDAIFSGPFCDSWYRYFLFCVIVPVMVLLVLMWIHEIVRAHRRRHFIRRAKEAMRTVLSGVRGQVTEHIDSRDMEKLITTAVLVGIKQYADRHPQLRSRVKQIMDVANGDVAFEDMETIDSSPKRLQPRRSATKTKSRSRK
jgi:hypothetical protein